MEWVYLICAIGLASWALWIFGIWLLNRSIFMGFKHLFESAKTTDMEEWLQYWQAAGLRFWKDAQK